MNNGITLIGEAAKYFVIYQYIELIVATTIFGIISFGVYKLFRYFIKTGQL